MTGDWRDLARCQETDPEAFFPEKGGDNGAAAKAVCASCPARLDCEDFALRSDQRFGIWGGHSPKELRKLRTARAEAAA